MRCLFIGGCADGTWHNVSVIQTPLPVRMMEPWSGRFTEFDLTPQSCVVTHTYVPWIHRIREWEPCRSGLVMHFHEHEHWIYRFEGITENQAFNKLIAGYSGSTSRCRRCRILNPIEVKE